MRLVADLIFAIRAPRVPPPALATLGHPPQPSAVEGKTRVSGLGSRVSGLGSRVSGLGSRVSCLVSRVSCLISSSQTRETPREFGFRLTLSGFSIETACAISKYLRLRFDPSSSVSARFLRAPVLPFALRPLPVHAAPEGSIRTPPHLAAVRCDSPGSGRPRRPLASLSEE